MYSKTELLREKAWRSCKGTSPQDVDALIRFMSRYCKIQHPELGSILIPLRPAQLEILETWLTERYSIVLKARQIGWSTLVALYSLWLAFFWPDQRIIMLSKGDREAQSLLLKATYAYGQLPEWMKARGPARTSRNVKKLSFANNSVIESMPSKEDPGRGSTASLIVVDEWAFLEDPEAAWASIEPIADIGGRVIGLSTAKGWGNFFHTMWVSARTGASQFVPMFYAWWANDDRDEAWYEAKKASMPNEWQIHQEYPSNEEEAFIKSGNPVFDVEALGAMKTVKPTRGILKPDGGPRSWIFDQQSKGALRIWDHPATGDAYALGADTAMGLEHGDFSCAHLISLRTARVVACWHAHIDPDLYGETLAQLGYYYNTALVGVEVNNHGLTTLKALQRLAYPRIYFRHDTDKRFDNQLTQIGWYTSSITKPLMIDELSMALRTELTLEDEETIAELMHYVRDEKGLTNGSPYDDRVISLAIANQMRRHISLTDPVVEEDDYWTFNYFMRKVLAKSGVDAAPMGSHNVRAGV